MHRRFPVGAGLLFGLAVGGFFEGVVLHQLLQWHHMLSAVDPPDTLSRLRLNTFWDGIFHGTTYLFVIAGMLLLWRSGHRGEMDWSLRPLLGSLSLGWGLFNTAEGLISHQLLGLHHVNELVPRQQWWIWDLAFLLWGLLMIVLGAHLLNWMRDTSSNSNGSDQVSAPIGVRGNLG